VARDGRAGQVHYHLLAHADRRLPGTFDPFTRGHEDLVRRAARLFDRVVVGVAKGESKRPLFTLDERVAMAREVVADVPNATVVGFDTLLMRFVESHGARAVLRGCAPSRTSSTSSRWPA
jgi:pantetheine-phosphate adenylyltransferase